MRVAVIPARGGSQRIPRKNIRPFCGRPMIAWPLEAARQSGCFERILVSTDDEEIAEVARRHGAEVPFLRPRELADHHTGTIPVIAHALRWLGEHGVQPEAACCVYATAPFLRAEDLRRGLEILEDTSCAYTFSVTRFPAPIQRAFRLLQGGRVEMFFPEHFQTRSQDLEEAWHDAAQFYWGRTAAWLQGRPIFSPEAAAVVLPRSRVQDIDTPEDWECAERMFRSLQGAP